MTRIRPHNVEELDTDEGWADDSFDAWWETHGVDEVIEHPTAVQELAEAAEPQTTMALALARAGVVSDE